MTVLHLGGARLALTHEPAEAEAGIAEAERLARQNMAELRQVVRVLAEDSPDPADPIPAPQPTATDLAALLEEYRSAGLELSASVAGNVLVVSAPTGLVLYRLVQEALANASRHAPGQPVGVDVRVAADGAVRATVSNPCPARHLGSVGGMGLHAMTGRVRMVGGHVTAGLEDKRWVVRAGAAGVISVVLVDDQELARAGLHTILRSTYGFEVVGEAADGGEALAVVARTRPDAVVMDVRMPRVDGVQATRALRAEDPSTLVLVLTTFGDDSVLAAALRAGASGFCLKDAPAEDIQRAVRAVAAGDGWLDPGVCGRVLRRYRGDPGTDPAARRRLHTLTSRELEVLRLIGRGLSNAEIAKRLFVGEGTVKTHVGRVFTKLAARDRAAAVVFAFDHGVVHPGEPEPPPTG